MDFYKYLRRQLKVSIGVIEYLEKRYGDEPSETVINRIMRLIEALKEIGLDIKYINQFISLLDIIDIYDDKEFESRLEYIKRMNKKRSPYVKANILIGISNVTGKTNTDEIDKIINLLEKEGLSDILEDRTASNSKMLHNAKYETIRDNLNVLKQVRGYKSMVRNNISILYKSTAKELKDIIEDIKTKDSKKNEVENNNQEDNNEISLNEKNNESENDSKNNKTEDECVELEGISNMVILGKEDNLTYMLNVLKKNMLSYTIILSCPEILKRKNLKQVNEIINILTKNNIPLSILEFCPEILQRGKVDEISNIIHELKINGLSLNIISVCPSVLILSNSKKIDKVIDTLEKNNMSRYMIYSCPEILISGNTKIILDINNEFVTSYPDINIMLDVAPYVIIEKIHNMVAILNDDKTEYVNRKALPNMQSITIIKNIDETQKIINVLKEKNIELDVLKKNGNILNKISSKQTKDILNEINNQGFDSNIIETDPGLIAFSSVISIREVTNALKEHKPKDYKKIIQQNPNVYIKSDKSKIDSIFKIFNRNDLNEKIIDENPQILIRENEQEIDSVYKNIAKLGFSKNEIEAVPSLLIEGESKYIEDNKKLFERNEIEMPLNILYVKPTENIERNIDTLVENDLYKYIKIFPQILDMNNSDLELHLIIAKQRDIPIVIKDENNIKKLNIKYFMLDKDELAKRYNIKKDKINEAQKIIERRKQRRVKNSKLFNNVYSLLDKQTDIGLEMYKKDSVSYCKNNKIVSKQKIIKETYIDLEENVAINGKQVLRKLDTSLMLNKTLEKLTKVNMQSGKKQQIEKILDK